MFNRKNKKIETKNKFVGDNICIMNRLILLYFKL